MIGTKITRAEALDIAREIIEKAEREREEMTRQQYSFQCMEPYEPGKGWHTHHYRKARTPLGIKLLVLRNQIVESGRRLLGWDEIERAANGDDE